MEQSGPVTQTAEIVFIQYPGGLNRYILYKERIIRALVKWEFPMQLSRESQLITTLPISVAVTAAAEGAKIVFSRKVANFCKRRMRFDR